MIYLKKRLINKMYFVNVSSFTALDSKKATVLAYNRPGYGESNKPQTPRDAQNVTAELREILAGVGHYGWVFAWRAVFPIFC